jgi:hypothetical protein
VSFGTKKKKGFTQRPQRDEERKEDSFAAFLLFAAFA